MDSRKNTSIRKRITISIIIIGVAIAIGICSIGYYQYKTSLQTLYNESGYNYGDMILENLDGDQVEKYATTWETDSDYAAMEDFLSKSWKGSKTLYVYVVVPNEDGSEMRYVYDSSGMEFGSYDPVNEKAQAAMLDAYNNGNRSKDYLVRKNPKYGYMTSSVLPVYNSKNEVVAVLFVDTNMSVIEQTLNRYLLLSSLISAIILVFFLILLLRYMRITIVAPLKTIKTEAKAFCEGELKISETLNKIKTGDEIEDTAHAVYQLERDIITYMDNLQSVTAEKERIGAELNIATKIQADMLPSIFPAFNDIPQADIYATMNPAKEVGGDFYDFFRIDDNRIGLVMADVSGKGVPAALFMVISKTLVKNHTQIAKNSTPSQILAEVNNLLCEGNDANLFCTCWLGIFDTKTGKMICSSAGHEYPAVRNSNGTWELFKDPHGLALAAMEDMPYKDYEITLAPGDAIFVYTDGVAEATNSNDELYGTDRMMAALNRSPMDSPTETLPKIKKDIDEFVGDAPQFDDITMLCLHYKESCD